MMKKTTKGNTDCEDYLDDGSGGGLAGGDDDDGRAICDQIALAE